MLASSHARKSHDSSNQDESNSQDQIVEAGPSRLLQWDHSTGKALFLGGQCDTADAVFDRSSCCWDAIASQAFRFHVVAGLPCYLQGEHRSKISRMTLRLAAPLQCWPCCKPFLDCDLCFSHCIIACLNVRSGTGRGGGGVLQPCQLCM